MVQLRKAMIRSLTHSGEILSLYVNIKIPNLKLKNNKILKNYRVH